MYAIRSYYDCGPRWAITETFPFERSNTSIIEFEMCEKCQEEYKNPSNRRFHSQTNSCSTCGVNFNLTDNKGHIINLEKSEFFKKTAQLLSDGNIIAIQNTSGFLLCCNAENKHVVNKLRQQKQRPNKPFAVLYPSYNFV